MNAHAPPPVLSTITQTLAAAAGLLAPRVCPCGDETAWLCRRCRSRLHAPPVRVDSVCDALQVINEVRVVPDGARNAGVDTRSVLPVYALGEYSGTLQNLILAWKNGGAAHLVTSIADGVEAACAQLRADHADDHAVHAMARSSGRSTAQRGPVGLVPVPSRLRARLRRGEDHTRELVLALAQRGAGTPLLLPAYPTTSQDSGTARQRRDRRIRLHPRWYRIQPQPVIVIDDVITTGSTVRAMHDALQEAGHHMIGAAVVAASRLPQEREILPAPAAEDSLLPGAHRTDEHSRQGLV